MSRRRLHRSVSARQLASHSFLPTDYSGTHCLVTGNKFIEDEVGSRFVISSLSGQPRISSVVCKYRTDRRLRHISWCSNIQIDSILLYTSGVFKQVTNCFDSHGVCRNSSQPPRRSMRVRPFYPPILFAAVLRTVSSLRTGCLLPRLFVGNTFPKGTLGERPCTSIGAKQATKIATPNGTFGLVTTAIAMS